MSWILKLSTILSLMALSGCGAKPQPQDSCNFVQNSQLQRVSWKGETPVPFYIHESVPREYHAAVLRAASKWEYALGRPLFRVVGIKTGDISQSQDGSNTIYWMKDWTQGKEAEQARTTIYWTDNMLEEADIYVDAKNFTFSTNDPQGAQVDFESLIVHEMGHSLGL